MIYERLRQIHYDKQGNVLEKIQHYNVYNRGLKYNFNTLLPEDDQKQLSNSEHKQQQPNNKWYKGYLIGVLSLIILLSFLFFISTPSIPDPKLNQDQWQSIPHQNDLKEGMAFGL